MNSLHIAIGIGAGIATIASAIGALFLVQYLDRQHSRNALKPYAQLRDWKEVPLGTKSLMRYASSPTWMRFFWGHAGISVGGTWKGMPAELSITRVYRYQTATAVAVGCTRPREGMGPVVVTDRKDLALKYYGSDREPAEPYPTQSAEFVQRFRIWGNAPDVASMFTPDIQRAVLAFPGQINNVSFDGKVAKATWLGLEQDPTVIDLALDLAANLCLEARKNSPTSRE